MKRYVTILLLALISLGVQAQKQISYIKQDGSWYMVYDESGKKVTTVSKSSVGEVVGWGSDFFVTHDGSWNKIFDMNGKRINTFSVSSMGNVIAVSGNTITFKNGSFIKIYDKTGKLIKTLSAR